LEPDEIRTAANGGVYLPDGTEKTHAPLYLGCRFTESNVIFNTGRPGYTLNKAALKTQVALGMPNYYQDYREAQRRMSTWPRPCSSST
jgi:hypothetical protein